MTILRLLETYYFPNFAIVSDKIILGTLVVSLAYLWIKEIRDRQLLLKANLELSKTQEQLKQAHLNTISTLINIIEAKDPYTRGHSERMKEYSLAIGKKIGLSKKGLEALETACILHDIGKTLIPDSILHKKETLTNDDWVEIKKHPQTAIDILGPLVFLTNEKPLILHHHERYDGNGYPAGIKATQIPLGARIMAVTDSFDAMRSKRPYRDPLSEELVLQEFRVCSGLQFDPQIVETLFELIKDGSIAKIDASLHF
jgi:HD-GYP domain-containing protein (c-di-GMP phosphodiesterase class II)